MNWLTNFVRPRIRALVQKTNVPDNLWTKCPKCGQMIFHREIETNLGVCPHCDHHMRLSATERLAMLFDEGKYQKIELPAGLNDPLKFRDRKRYAERLKEAQTKTGLADAIVVAHGRMDGMPVVIAAFEFDFQGGSMGIAVGEALVAAAKLAALQQAAMIAIPSSGGARMQEGILSLMQMPRTVIAVEQMRDAQLPFLVILTDPTTGGVSASFAMLGDVQIAEPGAVIGFAGARVIEETIKEKLPEGFQRAEYLLEHGMVDMVTHRKALRETVVKTLSLLMNRRPPAEIVPLGQGGTKTAPAPKSATPSPDAKAPGETPRSGPQANRGFTQIG